MAARVAERSLRNDATTARLSRRHAELADLADKTGFVETQARAEPGGLGTLGTWGPEYIYVCVHDRRLCVLNLFFFRL